MSKYKMQNYMVNLQILVRLPTRVFFTGSILGLFNGLKLKRFVWNEITMYLKLASISDWHKTVLDEYLNFERKLIQIYSGFKFTPNTNMIIFGSQIFTEYEYEYIQVTNFYQIRIRIYSGFKFSPNSNIFSFQIVTEYEYIRCYSKSEYEYT